MKVKSLAKTNGMNILKRPLAYAAAISVSFTKERITCLQVPRRFTMRVQEQVQA